MHRDLFSAGIGIGTLNRHGDWLEVFYPQPVLHPGPALAAALARGLNTDGGNCAVALDGARAARLEEALREAGETEQAGLVQTLAASGRPAVVCVLTEDTGPASVPEAYLKLHLLSHRLLRPHAVNLGGLFGILPNVAWTSTGAVDLPELPERQLQARIAGTVLHVHSVDKFPQMTNYVVPPGVRIADTARVRLGAYLGQGTTVMHEGFVNFNAGTEGPGMVEGRISAGVFVGAGSDLGGGCSTMGTLSGGNNVIISIGEGCLIGANAGVGIPLGDRCTIEAGLYITAGSVVSVLDDQGQPVRALKARELAGQSDLLFRRNSRTGAIEALTNRSAVELNQALHAHN